jgi:hypothetical protein
MPGPMPPQGPGAPAPGGAPPPSQPNQGGPGPDQGSPDQMDGQSPAMKAVSMANDGLNALGAIFEKAKGQIKPEESAELAKIIQAFQGLVESLSGGGDQGQAPAAKPAGGPMPAMAGKGSTPMDQG